jgi:hypothetical protein
MTKTITIGLAAIAVIIAAVLSLVTIDMLGWAGMWPAW